MTKTRWLGGTFLALLLSAGSTPAGSLAESIDPGVPVRPPARFFPRLYDVRLASHARRALLEDRSLAALNLGVEVKEGVATLWGPVPSEEVARRALRQVARVDGIVRVRDETYVRRVEPELNLFVPDPKPTIRSAALPDRDSGSLRVLDGVARELPPPEVAIPGPSGPPRLLPPLERMQVQAVPPSRPRVEASVVKATPPRLEVPKKAEKKEEPRREVPRREERKAPSLAERVEKLRQEGEYRQVKAEVRGDTVVVRAEGPGEYATAFAEQVRGLKGVRQVVIEE